MKYNQLLKVVLFIVFAHAGLNGERQFDQRSQFNELLEPSTDSYQTAQQAPRIITIKGYNNEYGIYNPTLKTAWIQDNSGDKSIYKNVEPFTPNYSLAPQYNIAPNKKNPSLIEFAYFGKINDRPMPGAPSGITTLYGVRKQPVKRVQTNKIISIKGYNNEYGEYNSTLKTAWIKDKSGNKVRYEDVVLFTPNYSLAPQYNKAPSEQNSSLRKFAYFKNNNHSRLGSASNITMLYGIAKYDLTQEKENLTKLTKELEKETIEQHHHHHLEHEREKDEQKQPYYIPAKRDLLVDHSSYSSQKGFSSILKKHVNPNKLDDIRTLMKYHYPPKPKNEPQQNYPTQPNTTYDDENPDSEFTRDETLDYGITWN